MRINLIIIAILCCVVLEANQLDTLSDANLNFQQQSQNKTNFAQSDDIFSSRNKLSLFSPERLSQSNGVYFGYSSDGKNTGSVLSFMHEFTYIIKPNMKLETNISVARSTYSGEHSTDLMPSFRLDWKPNKNTSITFDVQLPAQNLSGNGISMDPWRRNINR